MTPGGGPMGGPELTSFQLLRKFLLIGFEKGTFLLIEAAVASSASIEGAPNLWLPLCCVKLEGGGTFRKS